MGATLLYLLRILPIEGMLTLLLMPFAQMLVQPRASCGHNREQFQMHMVVAAAAGGRVAANATTTGGWQEQHVGWQPNADPDLATTTYNINSSLLTHIEQRQPAAPLCWLQNKKSSAAVPLSIIWLNHVHRDPKIE